MAVRVQLDCHVWYSATVLVTRLLAAGGREKPDNWITRECQKREYLGLIPWGFPWVPRVLQISPSIPGLAVLGEGDESLRSESCRRQTTKGDVAVGMRVASHPPH